ncbi:MAG: DUF177 domain-containing protein [Chloroflexota bacterium]|nr:MAG: DUF177 domain-containing protein [Chloroflexota bacterium]
MQINVTQLLKEPIGSRHSYHIDENIGANDIKSIKGDVTLTRTKSGIMVKCEITALVAGICSRCLKPIDCEVSYSFEEESLPSITISEDLSLHGQFDNLTIDESQTLDLTEAIQQYALLTMPVKPLCHPDCAGICPSCGQDLNKYPCQCPSRSHDQRWSKLISLGKESKT